MEAGAVPISQVGGLSAAQQSFGAHDRARRGPMTDVVAAGAPKFNLPNLRRDRCNPQTRRPGARDRRDADPGGADPAAAAILVGAFGQGNPGDEALCEAFRRSLQQHGRTSRSPAARRRSPPCATHTPTISTSPTDVVRALRDTDLVVAGGGTVFKQLHASTGRPPQRVAPQHRRAHRAGPRPRRRRGHRRCRRRTA